MAQPQFTKEERIFMYKKYLEFHKIDTKYMKHVCDEFVINFPNSRIPTQKTVRRIVQKFEKEGTVNNLPHHRERHVLTPHGGWGGERDLPRLDT